MFIICTNITACKKLQLHCDVSDSGPTIQTSSQINFCQLTSLAYALSLLFWELRDSDEAVYLDSVLSFPEIKLIGQLVSLLCFYLKSDWSYYGLSGLKQTEQEREEPSEGPSAETEKERAMAAHSAGEGENVACADSWLCFSE